MSRKKHLFIIHGRSTKPSEDEKLKMVKQALFHGLDRVKKTGEASKLIRTGKVRFSFVYYGDLSNQRMLEKNGQLKTKLKDTDPVHGTPCVPAAQYHKALADLLQIQSHTKKAYKDFIGKHRDMRWLDNAASMISWAAGLTGFSDNIIKAATADMGAYLMERKTGSAIRERLQKPLKQALKAGHDICLVSHSMGCIVSYDVLWKFSQMSEYRDVQNCGNRISDWITIGNPLGEPGVRKNLYDAGERDDGRFPRKIIKKWINIAARDDFVAHDNSMEDDFREMTRESGYGYVDAITDLPEIYTFWVNEEGTNPHKLYGYLDNPVVARKILQWMKR